VGQKSTTLAKLSLTDIEICEWG